MPTFDQSSSPEPPTRIYGLVIHGGAGAPGKGDPTREPDEQYRAKLQAALDAGYAVLEANGTATDAVVAAVKVMEDAGLFNAGKGSVLNSEGCCELDAAIMDGQRLNAGAVMGLQHIMNPIVLARAVMDKSPHVLLMGDGAEKFARSEGFEFVPNAYFQTERRREQLRRLQKERLNSGHAPGFHLSNPVALGTVGCVALDKYGNLAAATSTGGTADKLAGRIGDTPIIGAGTYANNATCAVSCTGIGEYYLRTVFGHNVSTLMEYRGLSLTEASAEAMRQMQVIGGHGGCIAIDREGNIASPFNTPAMYRGFKLSDGRCGVELYG